MCKASGCDGIPVEIFQILKDDTVSAPDPSTCLMHPTWTGDMYCKVISLQLIKINVKKFKKIKIKNKRWCC